MYQFDRTAEEANWGRSGAVPEGPDVEARELTYEPDGGSPAPLEDCMAPDGCTLEEMKRMMQGAKARLSAVSPAGSQPNVEWSYRLTTHSDGAVSFSDAWLVSVHVGSVVVAFAREKALEDAVTRAVREMKRWRATARLLAGTAALNDSETDKVLEAVNAA